MKTPLDYFYNGRRDFSIIALTGLSGSGCSSLAEIMAEEKFFEDDEIRKPEELVYECTSHRLNTYVKEEKENILATAQYVFKRKYSICYNFIKGTPQRTNYLPYKVIKYTKVLWLYILLYCLEKDSHNEDDEVINHTLISSDENLKNEILSLIKENFYPQNSTIEEERYIKEAGYETNNVFSHCNFDSIDWSALWDILKQFKDQKILQDLFEDKKISLEKQKRVANFFWNDAFINFVDNLRKVLMAHDYYCYCNMCHRLAQNIRYNGIPHIKRAYIFKSQVADNNIYNIVKLIKVIIKGSKEGSPTRYVIDSLRNSMESTYLKERYSGFYLIAVHAGEDNLEDLKNHQREELAKGTECDIIKNLRYRIFQQFLRREMETPKDGALFKSDTAHCIQNAEIHIINRGSLSKLREKEDSRTFKMEKEYLRFYTIREQWLKYAALILHPGLITPSSEERGMNVAYNAKFNSGCLSRQVGACITNSNHSIRTIGWNEVPYGQVSCAYRELDKIDEGNDHDAYSEFERGDEKVYCDDCSFKEWIKKDYPHMDDLRTKLEGLPLSYCFKRLHNRYEGKENQVFTRSLHAEENAMLQMVKYGGESLCGGIIYVTASPCELCSKKLYQIGVRKIVYIDPYPGIARTHIIQSGFKQPMLKLFEGAYGTSFYKLYQPFIDYKSELDIRLDFPEELVTQQSVFAYFVTQKNDRKAIYSKEDFEKLKEKYPRSNIKEVANPPADKTGRSTANNKNLQNKAYRIPDPNERYGDDEEYPNTPTRV